MEQKFQQNQSAWFVNRDEQQLLLIMKLQKVKNEYFPRKSLFLRNIETFKQRTKHLEKLLDNFLATDLSKAFLNHGLDHRKNNGNHS